MATINLRAGDFGLGEAFVIGREALHLPDVKKPGNIERIPLTEVASVETISEDKTRRRQSAARLGLAGAVLLGPIGWTAGAALAMRKPTDVTFVARLADGRQFMAVADSKTYKDLRLGREGKPASAEEPDESPDAEEIDAMINRYVEAKAMTADAPVSDDPPAFASPARAAGGAPVFGRRRR